MENENVVSKDNYLIEASYKLTKLEQKIVLVLASKIEPQDDKFKFYRMKVSNLAEEVGIKDDSFYKTMIKITNELARKVLEIYSSKKNTTLTINWFSSAEYFHDQGYVEFCFDPKLKPYLLRLKERFTTFKLNNVVQLKSSYSIRIYELLKKNEKIGTVTYQINELRKMLSIQENEYRFYANFRKKVIESAQQELLNKTDIQFIFTPIKEVRKVNYIRFDIYSSSELVKKDEPEIKEATIDFKTLSNPDFVTLIRLVPQQEQGKTVVINLLTAYFIKGNLKYIERNIKYANKNSKTNYPAYLKKALNADWGLEIQEEEETKQAIAADKELKRQAADNEKAEEDGHYKKALEIFNKLTDKEKADKAALYPDPTNLFSIMTKCINIIQEELEELG